jgi:hypothetical protein
MTILFSTLTSRLQNAVAARNSVPSTSQYEQAVRDAVNDFNSVATRLKLVMLSIQAGTAVYALPTDFVKFVSLEWVNLLEPSGVMVTGSGLVPISATFNEFNQIEGSNIRLTPTPTYTMARELWYGAGHVESGSPAQYAEMSEREARIILLLAQSIALGYQVNVASGEITSEQLGDVRVTRERIAQDLTTRAANLEKQYQSAVAKYVGALT